MTVSVVWQNIFLPEPNLTITLLTFAIFALTWFAHRSNIERLLQGKERETNIQAKLKRDKKRREKYELKQEKAQEKAQEKSEQKQEKQEQKEERKLEKNQEKIPQKIMKN